MFRKSTLILLGLLSFLLESRSGFAGPTLQNNPVLSTKLSGNLGFWQRISTGLSRASGGSTYGWPGDKDGAMAPKPKTPSQLDQDSVDRSLGVYVRQVSIRSGRLQGVQVAPGDFFKKYEKDLGLNLGKTDAVIADQNALKSNFGGYEFKRYYQYYSGSTGKPVRVSGSLAILKLQLGVVAEFDQNFIPGLDLYVPSTEPKITLEQARDIAMGKNPMPLNTTDTSTGQVSLDFQGTQKIQALANPVTESQFKSLGFSPPKAAVPPALNADVMLKPGVNLELGANQRSPLMIGFDGKRDAKNARLIWRINTKDAEGVPGEQIDVDAMTGKILHRQGLGMYLDSTEGLLGENVPVSGIPWPYYGSKGEAVAMTGNKKGDFPYELTCKKSEEALDSSTYCPATTLLVSELSPPGSEPKGVTSSSAVFKNVLAEVSLYKALQNTQAFFEKWLGHKGYQGTGNDLIMARIGKFAPAGKPASAAYGSTEESGVLLRFHGYPGQIGGSPTGPLVSQDIVGHEYFHGILDYYVGAGQGHDEIHSINEGLADFFGEAIEMSLGLAKAPWKIGEQIFGGNGQGGYLRNLSDPKQSVPPRPNTYLGYYYVTNFSCEGGAYCYNTPELKAVSCGPETGFCDRLYKNAAVVSLAFQLLAEGASSGFNDLNHEYHVQGIGLNNAVLIAFLSAIQLQPDSTIKDLRNKSLDVAKNLAESDASLFPDIQKVKPFLVDAVAEAWFAVGVGDRKDNRYYSPSDKNKDNLEISPANATLSWQVFPDQGEKAWVVEVADQPNLSNSFYQYENEQGPPGTQLLSQKKVAADIQSENGKSIVKASFNLKPNKVYYWHICTNPSESQGNCTEWHEEQYFGTEAMETEAIYPADDSMLEYSEEPVTFRWKKVNGIDKYIVNFYQRLPKGVLGKDLGTPEIVEIQTYEGVIEHPIPGMAKNLDGYCWDVIPIAPNGEKGSGSGVNCYGIKIPAPKPIAPTGEIQAVSGELEFKWSEVSGALHYELEICGLGAAGKEDCGLGEHLVLSAPGESLKVAAVGDEGHCWRIKAMGSNGEWGDASSFVCYAIDKPDVVPLSPVNHATDVDINPPLFSFKIPDNSPLVQAQGGSFAMGGVLVKELPENSDPTAYQLSAGQALSYNASGSQSLEGVHSFACNSQPCKTQNIPLQPDKTYAWQAFALSNEADKGFAQPKSIVSAGPMQVFKTRAKDPNEDPNNKVVIVSPGASTSAEGLQVSWSYGGSFGGGYAVAVSAGGSTPFWGGAVPANTDPSQGYVRIDNLGQKSVAWSNLQPEQKYEVSIFVLDKEFKYKSGYPMVTASFQTEKPYQCNTTQQAGGILTDVKTFNLGKKSGTFNLEFCTFSVPDRMIVSYQNATLWDSGCHATGEKIKSPDIDYNNCIWEGSPNIKYNGQSTMVTVTVAPGCDPNVESQDTAWSYKLNCPQ